ncbi:(deoxy)nucleoside triphosphate pyrophosphohydrolase [Corynebacterium breve]|uniref:8-oxo-dGTP diphosphatase n=1 Tax=Corynebacterium breve TaxID=3049799 RepID=A0ABY8VGG6_9CORY|nr:(deoxy)nucleoside triphosphate pyrophosphohydrolase [Corynebacterium breve]WIM68594.1 (deoxy)nucleoside triphosphate pyrophosphohydrolase [Corynebacterium breve]
MTKHIEVTGAVFVRNGYVFAAQRGPDKNMAGKWEFPGGKIERGETPQESLARELKEELLIDATVGEHITTTSYEYDFGVVNLATYYCTAKTDAEPVLTEHSEVRWVPVAELDQLDWAPADIPAVKLIMGDTEG